MRRFFPSISKYKNYIFCDNAGGSQIPIQVINSFNKFIKDSYTQPYCNNIVSKSLTNDLKNINNITDTILNNKNGKVAYGTSCTQLMYNFANSMENHFVKSKGEIILPNFTHESCVTPFERIYNKNNLELKWWNLDKNTYNIDYEELLEMVNYNTSMVVLPHVSNIMGNILDIKYLNKEIKKINPKTQVLVDGVAYLPHDIIDVDDFGVDYYIVSFYKFCGLRISALYIKDPIYYDSIMENQNHNLYDNVSPENIGTKLELGGINFELASGILGLKDYFVDFAKEYDDNNENNCIRFDRELVTFVMNKIKSQESSFMKLLEPNIRNNNEINIIESTELPKIPLYAFNMPNFNEKNVNLLLNELGLLTKNSTYHCDRLYDYLNIDKDKGLLRISLMHYNTLKEVVKVIECLNYFKKEKLDFDFIIDKGDKIEKTENIKNSFDNMKIDHYYDNKRSRAYSLVKVDNGLEIMGNIKFYQSLNYNNYNGNKLRDYDNIDSSLLKDVYFNSLVKTFTQQVNEKTKKMCKYIQVHQIRVYAENNISNLLPEGIHQDGFNIVGIACVTRENVIGGLNNIYDANKNFLYSKQLDEGEMMILNDSKVYHDVTNIEIDKSINVGYRDIFVFTTIA